MKSYLKDPKNKNISQEEEIEIVLNYSECEDTLDEEEQILSVDL